MKGTIFNIQRFSIHDGPGVRTTVFLKGCPLTCPWCHNPEGQSYAPELVYRENRCRHCGDCLRACALKALSSVEGSIVVDPEACNGCGACVEVCATGALEIAGQVLTSAEVMAEIERDRVFYDQSGGGVTFSGGEPLSQPDFLCDLLGACREREIHTALDTTGYAAPEVVRCVSDLADLFLFDVKVVDDERHRRLMGVPCRPILQNLEYLAGKGCNIILRVPIIPGFTDDEENICEIARLARSLGDGQRVSILPYHDTAIAKYHRLRRLYELSSISPPSRERLTELAALLEGFGLSVQIGG